MQAVPSVPLVVWLSPLTMVTQKTGFNKYKNLTVLSSTVNIDIGTKVEIQVKIVQGRISFSSLHSPGASSCFLHSIQPFFLVKDWIGWCSCLRHTLWDPPRACRLVLECPQVDVQLLLELLLPASSEVPDVFWNRVKQLRSLHLESLVGDAASASLISWTSPAQPGLWTMGHHQSTRRW